jgi:hypothetical protein
MSIDAAPPGFVEGHLKIISPKEVDVADGTPPVITAESYAEYPLSVLREDEKKEIGRVTADGNGNYHVAVPPGIYVLDVKRPPRVMLARETTAVHDCGESDCPCRYGYRYRRTLRQRDFTTELASELICVWRTNRGRLNSAVAAMTRLTKQVWNSAWQENDWR